ncbi:putative microtubule-associated protein [Helianthus anomalus]
MEVENKKTRREMSAMEKEMAALRGDKGRESRTARRPSAPRLCLLYMHAYTIVFIQTI